MNELVRRLLARPAVAAELVLASLLANALALASPLFVIQVLNRYVSHGIDATLATLTVGVTVAIFLETCFRQARLMMAAGEFADKDERRAIGAFGILTSARMWALERIPGGQRREIVRGLDTVEQAYGPPNVAAVLDVPFALLFLLALALLDLWLGAIAAAFTAAVFLYSVVHQRLLREPMRRLNEASAQGNSLLTTSVAAADTIRAFNGGALVMAAWEKYVRAAQELRRAVGTRQGRAQTLSQTAQALMGVAVIAVGAVLVVRGKLDVGTLIGANILAARALGPMARLAQLSEAMAKARQSLIQVRDLAKLPVEPDTGTALARYRGELEIRDVAFSYPGATTPLFESVAFKLAPGSILAATGRNGTGKTTFAKLLVGLLEPTRGQILADGVDLRQMVPAWWRRQIMYLPQEPTFLDGSVRDNLQAANPGLDEEALNRLVQQAGLAAFIDESPKGLDTELLNNGQNLALGVRRRLALARALATDGMLAVFDEPTEGLDGEGRAASYQAMKTLAERGRTLVLFSHDALLLRGARLILDLNAKPVPRFTSVPVGALEAVSALKEAPRPQPASLDGPPPGAKAGP
jgi:ATP-binding cassette subfamily C protein LapB